jgi:antitoxin component YwqK of YwqJK toxin-antitoxin module
VNGKLPHMKILVLLPLLIVLGMSYSTAQDAKSELRTWTAVNGKEVEAEFVSNSDGQVSLKMKTGKIFKVLLNKLSKADQDFITAMSSSIPQKEKPKTGKYVSPEGALNDDPAAGQLDFRGRLYYKKGSDTPYSGIIYSLYENGQPVFESAIKDGKSHGLYVEWYKNGQKKQELNNKDGKQDGLWVMWHKNGQKAAKINYKDGKPDGLAVGWHENGQKASEANFKDGKEISSKLWNSKGEPVDSIEEVKK